MSTPRIDLAFNAKLWAYNTGQTDRQLYRVIRVRKDSNVTDSRSAGNTLSIVDNTDAGDEWSGTELDLNPELLGSLVVLVGEILPEDVAEMELSTLGRHSTFNPDVHPTVATFPRTIKVVRRLTDVRCNLFRLLEKENGLCRVAQLPRTIEPRLVYYSEWTEGASLHKSIERKNLWRANITRFCRRYLGQNPDKEEESTLDETKSTAYLDQAIDALQDMLNDVGIQEIAHDERHIERIRQLIDGTNDFFDESDAAEAVQACEALWPILGESFHLVNEETLLKLAQGILQGALEEEKIPGFAYRPFIIISCTLLADSDDDYFEMAPIIQKAAMMAVLVVPDPSHNTT